MYKTTIITIVLALCSFSLFADEPNTLSKKEKKEGWTLLFDGKTFKNWHGYLSKTVGDAWVVKDGSLTLSADAKKEGKTGGDLVTDDEFENFEMSLDWKISEAGNSGVFWMVKEDPKYNVPYLTGPEMQVLDDAKHPDSFAGTSGNHKAGSLYDLLPPTKFDVVKPAGTWNSAKMHIDQTKGEGIFWLNGVEVVKFKTNGPEWEAMVNKSKFKGWEGFAKYTKGRLGLQDHGNTVAFRNIKVRKL